MASSPRAVIVKPVAVAGSTATTPPVAPARADERAEEGADATAVCPVDSAEARAAEAAISAVGDIVRALPPDASPKAAEEAIAKLFTMRCLELAQADAPALDADSGYALRHWWTERGGEWWLRHYLGLTKPRTDVSFPETVVAPTIRKTLTLETKRQHPLAGLLCPIADASCGKETAGWRIRADHAFTSFADRHRGKWLDGAQTSDAPPSIDTCTARAKAAPEEGYAAWSHCLARTKEPRSQLPLGVVKAPTKGWLFFKGRRGHYAFCDELRAYDLATGSAYLTRSCSGLALRSDGSVDGAKTNAARRDDSFGGTIPLDALREAAWMTVLSGEVQENVVDAWGLALPEGIVPRPSTSFGGLGMSFTTSSGQTTLAWSYSPEGASNAHTGTLTWPEDYNHAGRAHAVELLAVAEAGLVRGCPKALPPSSMAATFAGARKAACP
ncbi:MAG: hypothetical protein JST00_10205 [Deltaproteobacteria bacterium]|nr:hypothetical protein [Deltaproteobacteria bacterium]